MHQANSILIHGTVDDIFITAADLPKWPEFLSHYVANDYISKMPWGGIVRMSCKRTGIPVKWISRFEIDSENRQLHFEHLGSFLGASKGMRVTWCFTANPDKTVKVEIFHDLKVPWPIIGGFVGQVVVGWFLVNYIASKTLAGLKKKIEKK